MTVTWGQVAAWRMARHGLLRRAPAGAVLDVVSRLCGVHAQVMSSAELTLWARVEGLERDAVSRALWEEGSLVKTWAMRGTLHLLPARELPEWHAAFSTYEHFLKGAWLRGFGFTSTDEVEALIAAVADALDGRELTREELAGVVAERTGDEALAGRLRESWGSFLKPAAFRGELRFAPSSGQNVRFTRPPRADRPPAGEALAAVTRRYLAAYGPARREDLSRWWGTHALSAAKAQGRFEALGEEVVTVDVEGDRCWLLAADEDALLAATPAKVARLVPGFDQYVVGSSRGVEPILSAGARERVFRQAGWISPVLLVDGVMAGVWRHERKGSKVVVTVEPFGRVPTWVRRQVEAEAAHLCAFLGGAPELDWR